MPTRCLLGLFALAGLILPAKSADTLPDGLKLQVGNEEVELHVASPHAFRLHVELPSSTLAPAGPSSDIFLSGAKQPATEFTQVTEGSAIGLKTAFGEILVDPDAKTWSLRDADGKVLAGAGQLGSVKPASVQPTPNAPTNGATEDSQPPSIAPIGDVLSLTVGPATGQAHPMFYGSGTAPKRGSLTQNKSESRQQNGRASLPQYWSTAGYGLLALGSQGNHPATWQSNDKGGASLSVPGDSVDLYLLPAPKLYDWLRADAELTGFAPVPPIWSLGYFQSRWGWESQKYIEDALARFRQDQLPVDTFIIDFEWYTKTPDYSVPPQGQADFNDFDWNPALFPNPADQIASYLKEGVHVIGIRKPRLGNDQNLVMARSKNWILPSNNPKDLASTRNLDYSNPDVRAYWGENNRKFLDAGMVGFWNDEGELAYTEYAYWNLTEVDLVHADHPDARFWTINRSFSPGLQRLGAAVWTGDISGDWATFARTPGELLGLSLAGIPYSGCDIGGYRHPEKSPEVLTRWMEAGVFFPVMRTHSNHSSTPHFPWLSGPDAEAAIRKALDLRYQLIPYYYSLTHEAFETAAPLMRPLVMEFPDDPAVTNMTDEWLMGPGLLAAPLLTPGGTRSVYLPKDAWYEFGTNQQTQGPTTLHVTKALDEIPIYVRAGTLLPLGPVIQSTSLPSDGPLELQIYPGHDGQFTLTEDDGETTAYQTGAIRKVAFTWDDQQHRLSWKATGTYTGPHHFSALKAVFFGPQGRVEKPATLGDTGTVQF